MLVSIIVPAYKKEETIQKDISNIYLTMKQTRWEFEIIVVVDGTSLDNTFKRASEVDLENVKVVGYETNHGKGYTVRYGMARATGDYVAFIDAGQEVDPNGISMILEHMQWYDADIIVASKRHPASKVNYKILRRIYSWGYYLLARVLFGLKVTDTQTGLKVYKREVLEDVLPRLLVKEYAFDIELLAVAKHLGHDRIFDAPVRVSVDFSSSRFKKSRPLFLDPFIRKMFIDTLAVFYRINILKYYEDKSQRKWVYDKELDMNINTGEMKNSALASVFIKKEEHEIFANKIKNPKFSIIVPVRSINEFLKENIENLKKVSYKNFEVLIILDNNEEYNFKGDKRFKIFSVGPKSPGKKRNYGAVNSTGDILVFLDDDAYPSVEWLDKAAKLFENENIYALGAPAITPKNAEFLEKCSGRVLESELASYSTVHRHIPLARRMVNDYPTVNLFVRKDAFLKVGGFNEDFWPGEDTKLCLDLVDKFGKLFLYHPSPIVYHHRRKLFLPHLKQVSRYGRHRGHFARIFPSTSRLPSYFVPSLFFLGLIFGPILSIFLPMLWYVYGSIIYIYLFLLIYYSVRTVLYDRSLLAGLLVGFGIFLTHIVYGSNFVIGFLKKPELELKKFDLVTGNYVEG